MEKVVARINAAEEDVGKSELFLVVLLELGHLDLSHIICLALGSPELSSAARYQLALVKNIVDKLEISPSKVFLYDPVFTDTDKRVISSLGYRLESLEQAVKLCEEGSTKETKEETKEETKQSETKANDTPTRILYFLPHASLELTEEVLSQYHAHYLLANDAIAHTDRLTTRKLYDNYRVLSYLVLLTDQPSVDTQFQTVKKKRRQKTKVFVEPKLDFSADKMHFNSTTIKRLPTEGPWDNAFTDLAFHKLGYK